MLYYKIKISQEARSDIRRIKNYLERYGVVNVYKRMIKDIDNLYFMPRIHKTLYSSKDPNGEYRRIVSEKYIIIYQIQDDNINILRIFNHKEKLFKSKKFYSKEKITTIFNYKKEIKKYMLVLAFFYS